MSGSTFDTHHHVSRSSREQDRAAGSREARLISVGDKTFARASIELKKYGSTDVHFAYLRWSIAGKTITRYLGRVQGASRLRCLRQGWMLARERRFIGNAPTEIRASDET
jgi:DNA mismatch endonuclease, patch repair protein